MIRDFEVVLDERRVVIGRKARLARAYFQTELLRLPQQETGKRIAGHASLARYRSRLVTRKVEERGLAGVVNYRKLLCPPIDSEG